ncbi:MAG: YhcH/YjgK/YiaL family protein [Bilophila sp.]
MLVEHFKDWQKYDFGTEWRAVMRWLEAAWLQTQDSRTTGLGTPLSAGQHLDLSPGEHHVNGCTIHVMATTSRLHDATCLYEVHRHFCDVQMVLEGEEWLYNTPVHGVQLDTFNEGRDVGFCTHPPMEATRLTLRPGMFALLFPWDVHLPAMAVDNTPTPLRKCVAKIPLDTLSHLLIS